MSTTRQRRDTISLAVLILAAVGFVQLRAAAASQDPSSIDKVQRWLEELGVEQSVRDNFKHHDVDVLTLTMSSRADLVELGLALIGKQIKLLAKAKQEQEVQKR